MLCSFAPLYSQQDSIVPVRNTDSIPAGKGKKLVQAGKASNAAPEITIRDYKIISYTRDTTYLDTTLSILKEYKYNYLRKDNFELMPFANVGQPYNKLGVDFDRSVLYPAIGATAKHYNYLEVADIQYYNVPTPMTDLFFKTTFEQGQLLDAMLTFNTSRRLNYSVAYKGFRSLGKYQYDQAISGNFRTTANYLSKNGRYSMRAHIAAQDIVTEENGGLLFRDLQFESEDPEFDDRSRIDLIFTDAESKILGKRYYLDHQYLIGGRVKDTTGRRATSLAIGHEFTYETKYYQFQQDAQNDYFGEALLAPIDDKANLKTFYNKFQLRFSNNTLGTLTGFASLYNYNYYFNSLLITDEGQIDNQLKGEEISLGGEYAKRIGGFDIGGIAAFTVVGDLTDYLLDGHAGFRLAEKFQVVAGIHISSLMPNFNMLLYQSDYQNYNWQNTRTFDSQKVNSLRLQLKSEVLGALEIKYSTLGKYTYLGSTATVEQIDDNLANAYVQPFQEQKSVDHLKIKYSKEFRLGKWALNNTIMYQAISQSSPVLNVPDLVTRNTLYFSSDIFRKAMYVQTGVTFKYFTSYYMDAYNPLLGEFYVQNREELGGFPMLDFFINAKVRQTRIYLKAEHFNSSFSGNSFYSAPGYPYRDFVIRFGLVWNLFS